jgi:Tol biopolymer transport system component
VALTAGRRLGPYEILEPLGAGGMGEVYRAQDTRLKRDVALKVLPAELASEPERLGRFQREAETLAALDHPHIVTIFSVEEADGLHFLTMELVEGKTLSRVIRRDGLPLSRFFQIAIPLAEAVSAAHEKGIVHRDLKPGNVMVTEEDRVKVLDFGLAKLREGVRGEVDTESPTEPATGPGRVLGTAPYMSPEQVQGKALDHRSDVFALGIILYEMATGNRPFAGDTFADVASSILKDSPVSVTERKADLPRDLGKLIKHCLEKEPRRRFQSSLDLANELEDLRREVDSGEALTSGGAPVISNRAGGKRRIWLVGGAAVVVLALAVGSFLLRRNAQPPAAPLEIRPFTSDGGLKRLPQLSPDGEKVAYMWAGRADDNWDIYVKAAGVRARPIRLTEHPADDQVPVWSPDGRLIAFRRVTDQGWAIYTVPALGGQERKLTDVGPSPVWGIARQGPMSGLAWSPDGDWLALAEQPSQDEPVRIVRLDLATLDKQPITSPPQGIPMGDAQLALSPDGRHLAFVRRKHLVDPGELWVQPMDGGPARRLISAEFCSYAPGYYGLTWTADGKEVVFTAVTTDRPRMFSVPWTGGAPQPVAGIGKGALFPSIRERRMVYEEWARAPVDIWRIPGRNAGPEQTPEAVVVSSAVDNCPAFSPDDRRIAFASGRGGVSSIFVCNSDGSNPVQLTEFAREAGMPRWSPDGRRIAFDSTVAGDGNIYVIGVEGGVPRRLTPEPSVDFNPSWSRDGRWIYFSSDRGGSRELWKMPPDGGRAVQVTRNGGFDAAESWDGRYLYYSKDLRSGVWRMPLTGGEEMAIVSGPLSFKGWALAREGIYFAEATSLGAQSLAYTIRYLDFESGQVAELFRKEGPFRYQSLAVSSDERWILQAEAPSQQSELMLVENFR